MWTKVNGMAVHISGTFVDKDNLNPCLECDHFNLWGTSTGYCTKCNEDVSCNDSCDDFQNNEQRCMRCVNRCADICKLSGLSIEIESEEECEAYEKSE